MVFKIDAKAGACKFVACLAKWAIIAIVAMFWLVIALNLIELFGIGVYEAWTSTATEVTLSGTIIGAVMPCILFIVIAMSALSMVIMRYIYRKADSLKNKVCAKLMDKFLSSAASDKEE